MSGWQGCINYLIPPPRGGGKEKNNYKRGKEKRISTNIFIATNIILSSKRKILYTSLSYFHLNRGSKKCGIHFLLPLFKWIITATKLYLKYQLFSFPDFVIYLTKNAKNLALFIFNILLKMARKGHFLLLFILFFRHTFTYIFSSKKEGWK